MMRGDGLGGAALVALVFGAAVALGLLLVQGDEEPADLAPLDPPVLVEPVEVDELVGPPAPMTCAELRAGRDDALRATATDRVIAADHRQSRALVAFAWAYAAAECAP